MEVQPPVENHHSRLYDIHRHEAEDFATHFIKKRDEDLNVTLIVVSSANGPSPHTC